MAVQHSLSLEHARQAGLHSRLTSLNPQAILERGFAVVTSPDGQVVRRTDQAQAGQTVHIRVSDGSFPATVQPRLGKGRSK
jgi:exodeoxyribonuclease VII large subunit